MRGCYANRPPLLMDSNSIVISLLVVFDLPLPLLVYFIYKLNRTGEGSDKRVYEEESLPQRVWSRLYNLAMFLQYLEVAYHC
jgi:hypothetical protein